MSHQADTDADTETFKYRGDRIDPLRNNKGTIEAKITDWYCSNEIISDNDGSSNSESESEEKENVVFLLWGNFAKGKRALIDENKHLILESAHPSPLAGKAFQGNGHFSKTNFYLIENGVEPIDWKIEKSTEQLELEF